MSRILVIDDEPYIRKIIEFNLKRAGYDVITAEDSYEAEDYIEKGEEFDLIITDIMMPIRTGLEFIRVLRENYNKKEQKILILSARGFESDVEEAKKYNVNYFIMKPFKVDRFMDRVEKILKNIL